MGRHLSQVLKIEVRERSFQWDISNKVYGNVAMEPSLCRSYSNYQCAGGRGDRVFSSVVAQQTHGHGFDPQNSGKFKS